MVDTTTATTTAPPEPATELAHLHAAADRLARQAGHRPWVRQIVWLDSWEVLVELAGVRRRRTPWLRGLAVRGPAARQRVVWVAPGLPPVDRAETLTHELAHCMLPWRHSHTPAWLQLHTALLGHTTARHAAHGIAARAATRHGLVATAPPRDVAPVSPAHVVGRGVEVAAVSDHTVAGRAIVTTLTAGGHAPGRDPQARPPELSLPGLTITAAPRRRVPADVGA